MAVHGFSTREELHAFWRRGGGYLLNSFRNCLHETGCDTYRHNPPGLSYTRQGFDTPQDVLQTLGPSGPRWYPCPTCTPEVRGGGGVGPTSPHRQEGRTFGRDARVQDRPAVPEAGLEPSAQRTSSPSLVRAAALRALSESQRAEAVTAYDGIFGEMDRALWCLSRHCREHLRAGESTPVVEALVWTVKSWWGVQGVRAESKQLIAKALASMEWPDELFEEAASPTQEGVRFALDRVSEVVRRGKSLGVERREFSLSSKVLHWLLPWKIPVYDSFVRERLAVPSGWDHPQAYREIAHTLLESAHGFTSADLSWLGSAEPRSILRGFDKCLWWLGGGNAGTAVVVRDPWRIVYQLGLDPS